MNLVSVLYCQVHIKFLFEAWSLNQSSLKTGRIVSCQPYLLVLVIRFMHVANAVIVRNNVHSIFLVKVAGLVMFTFPFSASESKGGCRVSEFGGV